MQKQLYIVAICILGNLSLMAQQDLGIHFMEGVWQSTFTNPANVPAHKFVISLPGFYNQARIDNFTYNDVVRTNDQGQTIIDIDNVISEMEAENIIRNQADIPTLALGLQINNIFLQAGHRLHFNAYLDYPKELAQVLWQGNAQFVGQVVDIGPDVLTQAYHSFYVGASGEIAPGVWLGGRFKVLNGIADLSTSNRDLRFLTDEEYYQTTLEANYSLNGTGSLNYDGFNSNSSLDLESGNFNFDQLFADNYGLAVDLGVKMQYDRLTLSFSALDLGSITWRDEASNLSLNGRFDYEGLDVLSDAVLEETSTIELRDSLEAAFSVEETNVTYSTALPAKFYISGAYSLSERMQMGGLIYVERFREKTVSTFGLSLNSRLSRLLSLGGIYSYTEQDPIRIGANAALTLGPIQLMAATDNLLTAFRLEDSNTANFRVGLNLVFGRKKEGDINKISNQNDFFR
ncbi:MAG TPA: DUF5723 family protein [Saprospiraceae bacterium]|nr:DUF5723 family protein [Saprospiraceae bacterium]